MAWNKEKTQNIFKYLLVFSIVIAVITICLMIFNLSKSRKQHYFGAFIYVIVVLFGTGLGCIWFKIFRTKLTWSHAFIHTLVLILMLISNREMFGLLIDGKTNECIRRHSLSLLNVCVYVIQYVLSFHFIVFRYGTNASERAFRSGLHAFGGVLTFFVSFMDAVVVWRRLSWEDMENIFFPLVLVFYFKFAYAVCIWYLVLNPYFDWRRLKVMNMRKSSRTLQKKSSTSSVRSTSRTRI
ncbi:uncharacterized protein LOC129911438 [Episyrphus balteatus]|uniref:uncharacterized protein LOC129911438 n=1 Tax=Episyrphus balteatus TaxID=286459 RepID=UPI00248581C6|nr:uncharacterized protein LOC129911438 [Episyrphus balteatus]